MKCELDIKKYYDIIQEDRVYIFLDGLDDRLDKARSDVLQMSPFPTVEQAYAHVRREDIRQAVVLGAPTPTGVGLTTKGTYRPSRPTSTPVAASLQLQTTTNKTTTPPPSRPKAPTDGNGCTHCGNPKHTRETCFKLHGYPDWWEGLKARKLAAGGTGRAALVTMDSPITLIPHEESTSAPEKNSSSLSDSGNCGYVFHTSYTSDSTCWIIDSGATNHMTFDPTDFLSTTTPQRTSIANANGVTSPVVGAGTIGLSPSLTLQNTLLVPSLSNKLMSVG